MSTESVSRRLCGLIAIGACLMLAACDLPADSPVSKASGDSAAPKPSSNAIDLDSDEAFAVNCGAERAQVANTATQATLTKEYPALWTDNFPIPPTENLLVCNLIPAGGQGATVAFVRLSDFRTGIEVAQQWATELEAEGYSGGGVFSEEILSGATNAAQLYRKDGVAQFAQIAVVPGGLALVVQDK